ncbi:MAG TPA: hypothetical protein VGU20_20580 [Stellaceae bacterium]|nr:hypothetical protein [Stellaceae bacterium]
MPVFAFCASSTHVAAEQALNPQGGINLNGMCLERLKDWEGDFEEQIGGLVLAYRETTEHKVFVLAVAASREKLCTSIGGRTIVSTLDLPPLREDEWVAVSFDCSDPTNVVRKGDPLVAIFSKTTDQIIPDPAKKAWRINRQAKRFEPVLRAACRSFDE